MRVLVDGHNAMYALGLGAEDHAAARRELLRRVRRRAPGALVLFDARHGEPRLLQRKQEHGVRVRYCRGREADAEILDLVRDAERPERTLVVTNDREVRGRARQLGARTSTVERFFGEAPGQAPERQDAFEGSPPEFRPEDFGLPDEVPLDEGDPFRMRPGDFGLPDDVDLTSDPDEED